MVGRLDAQGQALVNIQSDWSRGNTTNTPLGSGATFTGEWEQNNYPDVMVSCQTDNTGTLYFDFSVDGENSTTFPVNGFAVASGIHEFHTAVKGPRYFRVRLVNDTGAQSYLRLNTYYGTFRQGNSPLNQSVGLDTDAAHVRPTNFAHEVRLGRRSGVTGWNKFGYRTGLLSGAGESTIWAASGNHTILTAASTFTIAYDGTGGGSTDGAGTTGATEITFYYIDANGLPAVAAHTLETDGSDVTSFTGLGINRAVVSASGALTYNASNITITATTGSTIQAFIPATQSVTQQGIFFTGANHKVVADYLHLGVVSSSKSPTVAIRGYVFNRTVSTRFEIFRTSIDTAVTLTKDFTDPVGFSLNETDVLYFTAENSASGNAVEVSIRFSLTEYQSS